MTAALLLAAPALAQTYPAKPVRIIVPTSPPGGADVVARSISQPLSERLGQQVIVDNRAGASTMLGGEVAARAAPDGYTLLMGISTLAINPATFKKVPYDALRDFVPITPEIPTIAEAGVPGYESLQCYGLLAPTGTPPDILARVHKEAVASLRLPEVVTRLANDGAEVVAGTPEEFGAFIRAETAKWAKVAKAAGIKPE